MPTFRRWSPHEDEILVRMYCDSGCSHEEIERALGRTWYSIVERAQKFRLRRLAPGEWSVVDLALLAQIFPDSSLSIQEIEQRFGRTWGAITQKARKEGLRRSYRQRRASCKEWSEQEVLELKRLYTEERLPQEDVKRILGLTCSELKAALKTHNVSRSFPNKYQINKRFFRIIENDEQAYFLGLMAADGCVTEKGTIELELQHRDRGLVERLRNALGPNIPLKNKNGVRLAFSSVEMAQDLSQFGVVPRKSYCFSWPNNLPEEFALTFLLGYFDGDGYFKQGWPGEWKWELLGTYDFLFAVKARLEYYVGIHLREPARAKPNVSPHLFRLSVTGKRVIALDRVLNASGLGLPRKHLPPGYRL